MRKATGLLTVKRAFASYPSSFGSSLLKIAADAEFFCIFQAISVLPVSNIMAQN
jgi:ABC-type multidrug transport system permease subunit